MIFLSSKVSDGNMSLFNRKRFFKRLGIKNVVEVKQVHGNKVVIAEEVIDPGTEADGLITNRPDIYLMIKVADCVPIGIHDPKHNAIGLIHAGYKGLGKGIVRNAVDSLKKNYGTHPKDLIIKFGPSIGPCHYPMDLWKEAENQLIDYGVLKKNIHNPRICTYESKDYFSHRRAADTNTEDFLFVTILGLTDAN